MLPSPRCLTLVVLTLAGCGSSGDAQPDARAVDAAPNECGATGRGVVTGSVGGETLAPIVRVSQISRPGLGVVIVLDEGSGACGQASTVGEHLVLGFCQPPSVGDYPIVEAFTCPGVNGFAVIEQGGGSDFADGDSGTVTITARSATCVSGTFDLMMIASGGAMQPLTGSFDAVICP
jgi:hypothetical protein